MCSCSSTGTRAGISILNPINSAGFPLACASHIHLKLAPWHCRIWRRTGTSAANTKQRFLSCCKVSEMVIAPYILFLYQKFLVPEAVFWNDLETNQYRASQCCLVLPCCYCVGSFSYSLRHVAGWSAVPDYFVGPAFFRGRLWIEHQPQDTFLKLQASPFFLSLLFFLDQHF